MGFVYWQLIIIMKKLLLSLLWLVFLVQGKVWLISNYNQSLVHPQTFDVQVISMAVSPVSYRNSKIMKPLNEIYNLTKYTYIEPHINNKWSYLSSIDHQLVHHKQPPLGTFSQEIITIEDYILLENKEFKIILINHSEKFKLCVKEIFSDQQHIKRIEKRLLPLCLQQQTKYPFYFNIHLDQYKPYLYRASIYFVVGIYYDEQLVDQKIWSRQVLVKYNHNHLALTTIQVPNCELPFAPIKFTNLKAQDLKINVTYQKNIYYPNQTLINNPIILHGKESIDLLFEPSQSSMKFESHIVQTNEMMPQLYLPIWCPPKIWIDYYDIGILGTQNIVIQLPISVSSMINQTIFIRQINLTSSTKTVQLKHLNVQQLQKIPPLVKYFMVAKMIIKSSTKFRQPKESISIQLKYSLDQNSKQMSQINVKLIYSQIRNAISVNRKKFIDVSQKKRNVYDSSTILDRAFPIRNYLNIPIILSRVIFDDTKFKIFWLQDRRSYIYSNLEQSEFSLQYIGTSNLPKSPVKQLIILEFYGNLYVPIEIMIYDNTLQCIQQGEVAKRCISQEVKFGYLKINDNKGKTLKIRNWNPIVKRLSIKIQNLIQPIKNPQLAKLRVAVEGPFPKTPQTVYQYINSSIIAIIPRYTSIIIHINFQTKFNTTSGSYRLAFNTDNQAFSQDFSYSLENATIALLPNIIYIRQYYKKSIQYLNLVSTYSLPYTIKSISTNLTNLQTNYNSKTLISKDQFVGIILSYQPYTSNRLPKCCDDNFMIHSVRTVRKDKKKQTINGSVKVVTSTGLQISAIVQVISNSAKILDLPETVMFDALLVDSIQEYRIKIKNKYDDVLRYRIQLFSRQFVEQSAEYIEYLNAELTTKVTYIWCVDQNVIDNLELNSRKIKQLFKLQVLPEDLQINQIQFQQVVLLKPQQEKNKSNNQVQRLNVDILTAKQKKCYKLKLPMYLRSLIQTGVLVQIGLKHNFTILSQFVNQEIINSVNYQSQYPLFYDTFYQIFHYNQTQLCSKVKYPIFKFCKFTRVELFQFEDQPFNSPQTALLQPQEYQNIVMKLHPSHNMEIPTTTIFYLVMTNNYTQIEKRKIQIKINPSKIKVNSIIIDQFTLSHAKYMSHYFNLQNEQMLQKILPLHINNRNKPTSEGFAIFQIKNQGLTDLKISHVGMGKTEDSCSSNGISIVKNAQDTTHPYCQGFRIASNQIYNLTVSYNLTLPIKQNKINLYLYNQKDYYIHFIIFVKMEKRAIQNPKSFRTFILNCLSFVFILSTVIIFKREYEQSLIKNKRKSIILPNFFYNKLGSKVYKKTNQKLTIQDEKILEIKMSEKKQTQENQGLININSLNASEEQNQILHPNILEDMNSASRQSIDQHVQDSSISGDISMDIQIQRKQPEEEHQSENQSYLPDGIQVGEDDTTTNDFDFEPHRNRDNGNTKGTNQQTQYNLFFNENPLKKDNYPFPWAQTKKKAKNSYDFH